MSKVCIQIVTYNSGLDIVDCLDNIKLQSYSNYEIIIIDNNSQDNTVEVIQQWQRDSPNSRVRLIPNSSNKGFAGGHNQAIKYSDSDYVFVLNPDVQLNRDYIHHILLKLEGNPTIGSATGKLYRSTNILDSTGISIKKTRRVVDRGMGELDTGQFDQLTDVFGVSGAAAIYRRKMINEVSINNHFFDPLYFAYKEDVDVAWRAQLFGWGAIFVPEATANHKRGWKEKSRKQIPIFIRQHSYINRYYTILKNDSFFFLLLHSPFILLYECASITFALLKERELFLSWKKFFLNAHYLWNLRKTIKNSRRKQYKEIYSYFKGLW